MANPVIFFSCHNIDPTQLLSHLQFRNLQITNIQAIGFPKGNSENMHEGIFDVLPVVDLNGVVERGDDLDFHSGLDVDAVAAFAAFGSYSVECHNQFSFSCYSLAKASESIKTYNYYQVHIGSYSKKETQCLHITPLGFRRPPYK